MCKDNRRLISLGADRTIRVWDLLTQEQLFQFDTGNHGAASLAVSPDERTWAVLGLDKTIRLFRGATVEEVEAEPSWRRRLKETDPERNDTPLSAEGVRP